MTIMPNKAMAEPALSLVVGRTPSTTRNQTIAVAT